MNRYKRPKPLEDRVSNLEKEWNAAKPIIAELAKQYDLQRTRVDVWWYCRDPIDRDIINYLIDNYGAGTTEIANAIGVEGKFARHLVGKRLHRIHRDSTVRNEPFLEFVAGRQEKPNSDELKYRAWWIRIEEVDVESFKKKMERKQ